MAVIEKLIQLPNLRHLDTYMPRTNISPPAVVFPSLEKLVIREMEGGSWFHILRNIPNPALRELEVTLQGSPSTYLQALESSLLGAVENRRSRRTFQSPRSYVFLCLFDVISRHIYITLRALALLSFFRRTEE